MTLIVNAEPEDYSTEARAMLDRLGDVRDGPFERQALARVMQNADVLIIRLAHSIDGDLLEQATKLKAIVSATTGLDHIDLDYARNRGIAILSLKGETEFLETITATAELTWALLLALVRNLPQAASSVRDGLWDRDAFKGCELHGLRLGILGLGRLGRMSARYGHAFGMAVAACDPYVTGWPDGVRRFDDPETLFAHSDIVTVHVPLNRETKGLVDGPLFARLPGGAYLINTSRGDVVDETALLAALEEGRLAGAALDVIGQETGMSGKRIDSPLIDYARSHANLIITPHIGGAAKNSMEKTEIFMARKLKAHLAALRHEDRV